MKNSYTIGIDAGGTKVAYGLFDEKGELVFRTQHPSYMEEDGPALSDRMIASVRQILAEKQISLEELKGVGVCMPSYINSEEGYIYMTSALTKVRDFPMRDYIAGRLGVRVELDNDANVAALAEHRRGAGRGLRHMVYVAVSTGIGSGIIINGQLFRGSYGLAGECGHMLITPDEGIECGCRNRGCFMSYAGGRYVPGHLKIRMLEGVQSSMRDIEDLSCVDLLKACREGDPLAEEMVDQMAHYLGVCLFNIYELLNINTFVFGGGLTAFGPLLFDRVRREFDRYNHIDMPVDFRFAMLEKDFGIIGAAELLR